VIVCHCNGVSDRAVRRAAVRGAADAEDVAQACGAGADCGACRFAVASVVDDVRSRPVLAASS
jgi:bacterioferritin-associated ferredoxin